ncbi:MAG: alpha/beta fold hydrolase [Acidimicrobiia bacterium]|nr:alpha/beta fold hydrolase [Acidimicrobiia bacterium]
MRTVTFRGGSGLKIVGDVDGPEEGPAVMLLHGGGQNRFAWKGSGAALAARGYRVVALDARGHGDSAWDPAADYEMETMAADLLAVIDQLGADRPAVVGASLGGITALEAHAVAGHRDIFSAVVLVDIAPKVENEGSRRVVSFMMANPDGFATLDEAAAAIAEYNPHRPPPSSTAGLAKVLRQGEDGRWRWHWDPKFIAERGARMLADPPGWEAERQMRADRLHASAGALQAPLLLIRGLLSDLVSDETVAALRAAAPQAEYVDVRGAGHMVAGDDNDAFTTAVTSFLGHHLRATA